MATTKKKTTKKTKATKKPTKKKGGLKLSAASRAAFSRMAKRQPRRADGTFAPRRRSRRSR